MNAIVARVRGLFTAPRDELVRVLPESGELKAVLVPYVLVLAAVGPVTGFLVHGLIGAYQPAMTIFNTTVPATWVRAPGPALASAALRYALAIGGFLLLATLLERLAPSFGGRRDRGGALKSAAVLCTPVWLAGAFTLLEALPGLHYLVSVGVLAGLVYAVLLGMWAVPQQLGVPESRAVGHVLAAIALTSVGVALGYWLLGLILFAVLV